MTDPQVITSLLKIIPFVLFVTTAIVAVAGSITGRRSLFDASIILMAIGFAIMIVRNWELWK